MRTLLTASIAAIVWVLAPPAVLAQQEEDPWAQRPAPAEAPPEPDASRLTIDLSLRYESGYFFRGIALRPDSFNLQPAATITFTILEEEDFSLAALGSVWNNLSDDTAPGSSGSFAEHWYEVDFVAGVALTLDRVWLTAVYNWYESPASDFVGTQDVTLTFGYDDAGLWDEGGVFALNPGLTVAVDTRGAASGPDGGVWLGVGARPTVLLGWTALGGCSLTFPTGVGLSLHDYYQSPDGESSTYGYFETGAVVKFNLAERFGPAAPAIDFGFRYLNIGGVLKDYNDGNGDELILTAGLAWQF